LRFADEIPPGRSASEFAPRRSNRRVPDFEVRPPSFEFRTTAYPAGFLIPHPMPDEEYGWSRKPEPAGKCAGRSVVQCRGIVLVLGEQRQLKAAERAAAAPSGAAAVRRGLLLDEPLFDKIAGSSSMGEAARIPNKAYSFTV